MNVLRTVGRAPRWRSKLAEVFGIDPRSLALFRIGAALLLLYDQLLRLGDLHVFYTDDSISPRHAVDADPLLNWSVHSLAGSAPFEALLFGIAICFSVALLVGFHTRAATFFSCLLLASVHARAPLVGNGGDGLLRLLLFWGVFTPLGRCWSVDAWLARARRRRSGDASAEPAAHQAAHQTVLSFGTTAMLLQLALMYFVTGVYKMNADWLGDDWLGGEALYWSMRYDYFILPPARYLAQFPALLEWLALGTVWLEVIGPVVVFVPWQTGKIRLATIAAFAGLHFFIQITLTVGMFSFVSMVGWMLFVPPGFWNARFWPRAGNATDGGGQDVPQPATETAPTSSWSWRSAGAIAGQALCAAMLVCLLLENVSPFAEEALEASPHDRAWLRPLVIPPRVHDFAETIGINQHWGMFSNSPKVDGWFVARARLADGEVVDLLQDGRPAVDDKPEWPYTCFPNEHQRYFFNFLPDDENAQYRQPAAEFLFRRWNAAHGANRRIVRLELDWHQELVGPKHREGAFHSRNLAVVTAPTGDLLEDPDFVPPSLLPDEF